MASIGGFINATCPGCGDQRVEWSPWSLPNVKVDGSPRFFVVPLLCARCIMVPAKFEIKSNQLERFTLGLPFAVRL